jgi:hypothetical protein
MRFAWQHQQDPAPRYDRKIDDEDDHDHEDGAKSIAIFLIFAHSPQRVLLSDGETSRRPRCSSLGQYACAFDANWFVWRPKDHRRAFRLQATIKNRGRARARARARARVRVRGHAVRRGHIPKEGHRARSRLFPLFRKVYNFPFF